MPAYNKRFREAEMFGIRTKPLFYIAGFAVLATMSLMSFFGSKIYFMGFLFSLGSIACAVLAAREFSDSRDWRIKLIHKSCKDESINKVTGL